MFSCIAVPYRNSKNIRDIKEKIRKIKELEKEVSKKCEGNKYKINILSNCIMCQFKEKINKNEYI
jgi:hypothetical protein